MSIRSSSMGRASSTSQATLLRLAIDPGDLHVGWARSLDSGLVRAGEWSPADCCNEVIFLMTQNKVDELIIEEYVLYPKEYQNQVWSDFRTPQLIGALKHIAWMFRVPVVMQGASIKTSTRNQLKARKIRLVGPSIHARDAELHLYHRILRRRKEEELDNE